jgi:hypothetical protein
MDKGTGKPFCKLYDPSKHAKKGAGKKDGRK